MDTLYSLFIGVAAAGAMLGLLLNSGPGVSSPHDASVSLTSTTHSMITPVSAAPVR
jgi:hypothetical protein